MSASSILSRLRHKGQITEKEYRKLMEIKNMAKAEPCDTISREAVREFVERIQTIKNSHNENGTPINYGTICDLVIQGWKLMKLPSVQPSRKGHWIVDRKVVDKSRKPTTYHFDTHCSECGFKYAYTTDKEGSLVSNFCPNCGSYNGGDDNGNE